MGRPPIEITEKMLKQAKVLAGYGLKNEQIADVIGLSRSSMLSRPEFLDAIQKGRSTASAAVMQSAFEMAISKKNVAMTIFWLKCRELWKECIDDSGERKTFTLAYDPKNPSMKPTTEQTTEQSTGREQSDRPDDRAGDEA